MKQLSVLLLFIVLLSCGNERVLYLPEIQNSQITEVTDVSHAYLFYDETKEDSIDLNRKNLIGTTNWLINVDKRLTLEQAIPKITFLQDKKRSAKMHKNETAKNYYTCSDTRIKNLGFLEFTDVFYQIIPISEYYESRERSEKMSAVLNVISLNNYSLEVLYDDRSTTKVYNKLDDVINDILSSKEKEDSFKLYILYHSKTSFQDYITVKFKIHSALSDVVAINNNEFIY
ncbi:hypothetical protein SAMN04515667_1424 [Formosa sp. Hel1_31_208]|uniref:hypothetical protein n=1 Tax=Formosa sp. Hel1_31_208 TaxID=1798225 RepID=UPI00087CA371|nr:hypothetical protein [Formosa sp. Hel1_31_208]SDS10762.1 hypothetical protein SAMN04515667_1424 [Formosa sp. Hel1_31_208]